MSARENRSGREILRVTGVGEPRRGTSGWRENRRWVPVRVSFAVPGAVAGITGACQLGLRMDGGGGQRGSEETQEEGPQDGGWDSVVSGVWGGIGGEAFLTELGDGRDMGGEGERRREDDSQVLTWTAEKVGPLMVG